MLSSVHPPQDSSNMAMTTLSSRRNKPSLEPVQVALRRSAFMAVSTNVRHTILSALNGFLQGGSLWRPAAIGARAATMAANSLVAAWQWRGWLGNTAADCLQLTEPFVADYSLRLPGLGLDSNRSQ